MNYIPHGDYKLSIGYNVHLRGCVTDQETSWGRCWSQKNCTQARLGHRWRNRSTSLWRRRCSRDSRRPIAARLAS